MKLAGRRLLVCGGGGFIGGHLVKRLLAEDAAAVRCVDIKPLENWQQLSPGAENLVLDLRSKEACAQGVTGMDAVFNLASDMGGISFIEQNAREAGIQRYFLPLRNVCAVTLQRTLGWHAGWRVTTTSTDLGERLPVAARRRQPPSPHSQCS